jgi:hypothetical protein
MNRWSGPPHVDGWALGYVESEYSIPESWRNDFYDELTSENVEYRELLEEAVRWYGVRWAK